jgi:hypothetical protein
MMREEGCLEDEITYDIMEHIAVLGEVGGRGEMDQGNQRSRMEWRQAES